MRNNQLNKRINYFRYDSIVQENKHWLFTTQIKNQLGLQIVLRYLFEKGTERVKWGYGGFINMRCGIISPCSPAAVNCDPLIYFLLLHFNLQAIFIVLDDRQSIMDSCIVS